MTGSSSIDSGSRAFLGVICHVAVFLTSGLIGILIPIAVLNNPDVPHRYALAFPILK